MIDENIDENIKSNKNKLKEKINFKNSSESESSSDFEEEQKQKKKIRKKKIILKDEDEDEDEDEYDEEEEDEDKKKKSKKKILNNGIEKKKPSSFFNIKQILNNNSDEKILIICEKDQSSYIQEYLLYNTSTSSISILEFKSIIDIISKIIKNNTSKEKKIIDEQICKFSSIFLISENPLLIFTALYFISENINCIYDSLSKNKNIFELLKNPNYDQKKIDTNLEKIKENYNEIIEKKTKDTEDKINNMISIELEHIKQLNMINYYSGLTYIEEEIIFYILKNNLEKISFNSICSYLYENINIYFEKHFLISFKNLIKKFYDIFFETNIIDIKKNTEITINIKLLKMIYFIFKKYEIKKKIILVSIIPTVLIEYTNYLKYNLKDIVDVFYNNLDIKNLKKENEKYENINLQYNSKNVIFTYEIKDNTKIDFSYMNIFDNLALIKKLLKKDSKLSLENKIFSFSTNISEKKYNIQKKIFKPYILLNNGLTHFNLDENISLYLKNYLDIISDYIMFIHYINLYNKTENTKSMRETISEKISVYIIKNCNSYIFSFEEKKKLKDFTFDDFTFDENFDYDTIDQNISKNYLKKKYKEIQKII